MIGFSSDAAIYQVACIIICKFEGGGWVDRLGTIVVPSVQRTPWALYLYVSISVVVIENYLPYKITQTKFYLEEFEHFLYCF